MRALSEVVALVVVSEDDSLISAGEDKLAIH